MRYLPLLLIFYALLAAAEPGYSLVQCKRVTELSDAPDGNMRLPTDVAVDEQGRIYVVDSGNRQILVFSSANKFLFSFGSKNSNKGEFRSPVGITVTKDGRVLVADRGSQKIVIFSRDGKYLKSIQIKIKEGVLTPIDVAVDKQEKRIFVTVTAPFHQIAVLDNNGKLLSRVGKPGNNEGEFRYPATISVSDENEIYVVDVLNTRAQVFDEKGKFLVTVGSWGVTQGQLFRPKGIALSPDKRILVSDSYLGVIQIFNNDTRFKGVLATGGEIARFTTPVGMAVDSKNRVYIAESMANRVSVCHLAP
jgi:DNA-binding beta-propeller fold protein YncE